VHPLFALEASILTPHLTAPDQFLYTLLSLTGASKMDTSQIFSDEVWAMGGAYTTSYVTVRKDGLDRYWPANFQHKYSRAPAWMFIGSIVGGRKAVGLFWEKEWGNINSAKYNLYFLSQMEAYMQAYPGLVFMQDNASSYRSKLTERNLDRCYI
jgi:hypothetical protein